MFPFSSPVFRLTREYILGVVPLLKRGVSKEEARKVLNQLNGVAPLRGIPQLEGQVLHLPTEVVPSEESAQHQNCRVDG